jgi:predicted small integral membrane protein
MIAALAAFAFIVAYDNIVDYDSNYEFVRHVLSMDTTFPNNALMGRAITDKRIWTIAYSAIIAVEALTCLLLGFGRYCCDGGRHVFCAALNRDAVRRGESGHQSCGDIAV